MRHADARGAIECDQCSWKLDSSTAMTSNGWGSRTASSSGVPTLPALVARRPAARSMAASIWTVVVLPLVPVTTSQGAAPCWGRIRQASSTSPQTGMPRRRRLGEHRLVRAPARGGDDEVDLLRRHTGDGVGAERQPGAEDVEDAGLLGHRRPVGGDGPVDDENVGPALEEGIRGGEPADAEPGHEHRQAGPARVPVGQPGEPVRGRLGLRTGGGVGHPVPTTHSA